MPYSLGFYFKKQQNNSDALWIQVLYRKDWQDLDKSPGQKDTDQKRQTEQHTTEMGHYLDQGEDERMADEGGGGEQRELKLREKERWR